MNTLRFTPIVVAVLSLIVTSARADEASYAKILKEREAVLSELVTLQESRRATGTIDEKALLSARLALSSFRRDTATSLAEKIKHQETIVGVHEKELAEAKARFATGLVTQEAILLAKDSLLQAQQTLEELRLKSAGKGE